MKDPLPKSKPSTRSHFQLLKPFPVVRIPASEGFYFFPEQNPYLHSFSFKKQMNYFAVYISKSKVTHAAHAVLSSAYFAHL